MSTTKVIQLNRHVLHEIKNQQDRLTRAFAAKVRAALIESARQWRRDHPNADPQSMTSINASIRAVRVTVARIHRDMTEVVK